MAATIMGLILALATMIEGIVEYFCSNVPSEYKKFVAAGLGVVVCVAYGADILAAFGYTSNIPYIGPYIGSILTGILIGRGSNYLNDIVSRIRIPQLVTMTADTLNTVNVQTDQNTTILTKPDK